MKVEMETPGCWKLQNYGMSAIGSNKHGMEPSKMDYMDRHRTGGTGPTKPIGTQMLPLKAFNAKHGVAWKHDLVFPLLSLSLVVSLLCS